jgi:hypothetical protein
VGVLRAVRIVYEITLAVFQPVFAQGLHSAAPVHPVYRVFQIAQHRRNLAVPRLD